MSVIKQFATAEFLYKPTFFKKVDTGNDILFYSKERKEELALAGALKIHDQFWTKHPIVTGTVYGAIPCKYIDYVMTKKLMRFGWRRAHVELYIFRTDINAETQRKIAEQNFQKFILTRKSPAYEDSQPLLIVFKSFFNPTGEVRFEQKIK